MAALRIPALALSRKGASVARAQLCARPYQKTWGRPILSTPHAGYSTEPTAVKQPTRAPVIDRAASKLFKNADEAVADLQSDSTLLSSGFGLCGVAGEYILQLANAKNT